MADIFDEARDLMESGEMPDRVSNRLLWAAVYEERQILHEINGRGKDHETRLVVLEWAARLVAGSLLALVLSIVL